MLRDMPAPLLQEWIVYFEMEPFGELRADARAGTLASLLANIHRDEKKQREPFEPGDFFPALGKRERPGWQKIFEGMQAFKMRLKDGP